MRFPSEMTYVKPRHFHRALAAAMAEEVLVKQSIISERKWDLLSISIRISA